MPKRECDIGVIGLGTMGRNLALNFADHGFAVAAYNRTAEKTREFMAQEVGPRQIRPGYELREFAGLLKRPRAILLMVSAGDAVDAVIKEIWPLLVAGDLLIDGGNSHFTDTNRRGRALAVNKVRFMGMGVSGGEAGARYGPSLMPGGQREAYDEVAPMLEAAAAKVNGDPCVAYLGPRSAGHYVKMVHNGIEYGVMELIAETYDLLKRGLGMPPEELHQVYADWNREELSSFLLEITSRIFLKKDDKSGKPLIDLILDRAKQKGTGMWTSWEAMDLQVGTPNIDIAVVLRDLSGYKEERQAAAQALAVPSPVFGGDRTRFLDKLKNGFYAGMIATYAQGLALLKKASNSYAYGLDLETVARIWRGGCIIRAALLEEIRAAFKARPDLENLLLDPKLGKEFLARQQDLRDVVGVAAELGLPAPGLMMSLAYFDACRSAQLPANLIQAQRDYFGAHTYERLDAPGTFHTEWDQD